MFIVKRNFKKVDHRRTKESYRKSGKENGKRCFKNQLQKTKISQNLNTSSHFEMLFNRQDKIYYENSLKISKEQRFQHLGKLTGKFVMDTKSKTTRFFEAGNRRKIIFSGFSISANVQHSLCRTHNMRTLRSYALMKTKPKETPTSKQFTKQQEISKQYAEA